MEHKYVKLIQEQTEIVEKANDPTVGFDEAFDKFFKGTEKIFHDYINKAFPRLKGQEELVFKKGKKYIKLIKQAKGAGSGSVHAFVDTTTGDVFKPASFNKPAKGARGNIYDKTGGLGRMTAYGPEYNK
jgi:hypothetical protein